MKLEKEMANYNTFLKNQNEQEISQIKEKQKKLEEYENDFMEINKIIQVASVSQILSHLEYLKNTKERLTNESDTLSREINNNNVKYQSLEDRINNLLKDPENEKDRYITDGMIEKEELEYQKNIKELEASEFDVIKLDEEMASINSCISRMSRQLGIKKYEKNQNKAVDVSDNNCVEFLSQIGIKLETLIKTIDQKNKDKENINAYDGAN